MLQCDIWSRYFISSSLSPRHLAEVFAARLLHFLFCLPCLSSFCFVLIHFLPFPSFSSFFAHHPSDPKSLQIPYFLSSNLYSCIHPPPRPPPPSLPLLPPTLSHLLTHCTLLAVFATALQSYRRLIGLVWLLSFLGF